MSETLPLLASLTYNYVTCTDMTGCKLILFKQEGSTLQSGGFFKGSMTIFFIKLKTFSNYIAVY